jgi:hypothetical protein
MGVRHFCVGWDVRILNDWFIAQGKAMEEAISGRLTEQVSVSASRGGYN